MDQPYSHTAQDRLQELLDKEALRELAARYARAIDRVDMDLLRTVYHPDAIDHHGNIFCGPAAEFIAAVPEMMKQFDVTQHAILNCSYRIVGHRADGELYFSAYHRTKPPKPQHQILLGRYLDNYECRNGEWRIAHRRLAMDSWVSFDAGDADMAQLRALGVMGGQDDDYSYEALHLMGRGQ